jgi:hypothetical protein
VAIDFPASPTIGQTFSSGGRSWIYDGAKWVVTSSPFTPTLTGLADQDILEYDTGTNAWVNTSDPKFTTVDLNSVTRLTANLQSMSVTSPVQFDSWSSTLYRSAEYLMQFTQGTNYSVTKVLIVHNGTDAAITEYGHVEVGTSIDFVIGTGFAVGNLELTVTCSTANVTPVDLQFSRILFEV